MSDAETRSLRRRVFAVRALTATFVGLILDWHFGGLKFAEASLNFAAAIMALCLSCILFGLLLALPRRLSRTLGLVAIVKYPADDAVVVLLDRHHVRCTFPLYGDRRTEWTQQGAWIF